MITNHPATPQDPAEAELHEHRRRIEAAENAFDAGPICSLMAEDAVIMVPDFPVQEGRAACVEFVEGVTRWQRENLDRHITYVSAEVRVVGDVAFDRGTFSFTVSEQHEGGESVVTGKYFWLYSRTADDHWRLARIVASVDEDNLEEEADPHQPGAFIIEP
jgi:ketosteroid isomerase-like protein